MRLESKKLGEIMNKLVSFLLFFFIVTLLAKSAMGLTIVFPTGGHVVTQGEQLTVIVKPDAGENWTEVILDIYPMPYNSSANDYRGNIEIPEDELGNIDFTVGAYDSTGKKVQIKRNLFVKMSPNENRLPEIPEA
jgi:hypothetical protein